MFYNDRVDKSQGQDWVIKNATKNTEAGFLSYNTITEHGEYSIKLEK